MTINILYLIIPGLVAILGNIIFYLIVKKRIDKSIEKHKISYAGIFKEKLEIHKKILKRLFKIKQIIQQYQYSGNPELEKDLFLNFNKLINFYTVNQPFLNTEIIEGLKNITAELQECFEDFHRHHFISKFDKIEPKIREDTLKKFFESGNKFKKDQPFKKIEDLLISEIKKDLNMND